MRRLNSARHPPNRRKYRAPYWEFIFPCAET
jgi:hypothetical protein